MINNIRSYGLKKWLIGIFITFFTALIIISCLINVFAVSNNGLSFNLVPFGYAGSYFDDSIKIGNSTQWANNPVGGLVIDSESGFTGNATVFAYPVDNSYQVCIVWDEYINSSFIGFVTINNYIGNKLNPINFISFEYREYNYYYTLPTIKFTNITIPVYDSVEAGIDDAINFLNGGSSQSYPFEFSLPAGNAMLVEFKSDQFEYSVQTTMNEPSALVQLGGLWWPQLNQGFVISPAYGSYVPGYVFHANIDTIQIPWIRDGNPNVLGQYTSGYYDGSYEDGNGGKYLLIYNPVYSTYTTLSGGVNGTQTLNNAIQFAAEDVISVKVFSLRDSVNVFGQISSEIIGVTEFEFDDQEWIDPDTGEQDPPVYGGGSALPTDGNLLSVLNNFFDNITSIFTRSYESIEKLSDLGDGFFKWMKSLYSWMPEDLGSIVVTAFSVILVIGIVTAFL